MSQTIIKTKTRCGVVVFKPAVKPRVFRKGWDGELLEGVDFYRHAQYRWNLGKIFFAVKNEGKVTPAMGKLLNDGGRESGTSDYICLKPSGKYHHFALEIKREDGGDRGKPEQKEFLRQSREAGGFACIAHGYQAALYALELYLNGEML